MFRHSQWHYSEDDYFAVEASSGVKHEFNRGEIFAMAGASLAHNHLSANVRHLRFVRFRVSCGFG
jgi:hypothetical protein